jgi:hypothetical protein
MTPYEVLGIAPDATADEAEEAYSRLLLIHHPDLHQGGSADEIAAAEARTRLLNQAMHQIRSSFANASMPGARGAPETGRRPPGGPTADGSHGPTPGPTAGHDDPGVAFDPQGEHRQHGEHGVHWGQERPSPVGTCPFCGERFTEGARMRDHVSTRHKVRLEHRRRSRVGRSLDRFFGRWDHVSLWHLAPLNLIVALIIAVAVAPLAVDFAYWVFGVAMAPTIILALERPGR